MNAARAEAERLLYTDEKGEVVGLDEVQLLDPPPLERIAALHALLVGDDAFLAYQAALVLTAWGDEKGLAAIEKSVDARIGDRAEYAPDRLTGRDNVYDEFADAVHVFGLSRADCETDRRRIFGKLLDLYGAHYFRSRLKHALLRSDFADLAPAVERAVERAFAAGEEYQASQLLPVLARWDQTAAERWLPRFERSSNQVPNPQANVAEAFGFIKTEDSRRRLAELSNHADAAVAAEAQTALARSSV